MPTSSRPINDYLLDPQALSALRQAWVLARKDVLAELRKSLPRLYDPSLAFVNAIDNAFYGAGLPDDSDPSPREMLSVKDRERCLIALLATQSEHQFLAVHIYIALMEGVSQQEIAHILFLAGIYTGVSRFNAALGIECRVLQLLEDATRTGEPGKLHPFAIHQALLAAFP